MSQYTEHATWLLYETYHLSVNVQRDRRTYDHFASSHARTLRQEQLLTTYLAEMIAAITRDVNTRGDCWLIRAILQQELPAIHLLDRSAIACVYARLFTPEEATTPDARTIPYSAAFSTTPGGMRYADRNARNCVIDLRTDATLHLLCHALLSRAALMAREQEVQRLQAEALAMNSRLNEMADRLLGLERENARLAQELHAAQDTPAPAPIAAVVPSAPDA